MQPILTVLCSRLYFIVGLDGTFRILALTDGRTYNSDLLVFFFPLLSPSFLIYSTHSFQQWGRDKPQESSTKQDE